ncbi:Nitrogenase molybdenum-iron protein, alpha and beta chains [Lachnospiraceae bacterium NK3A20]|nr:Nitrogenase molybdenum-iron protein, alpha and beta chains [Lachnospiraceae bacterium NK3A20]
MNHQAVYYTAAELSRRGRTAIPAEYDTAAHLVYSSPATLAYNSPGAEGFGVKRAGLSVPGSVMLIVAPGCCGRNTSAISEIPGYRDRFFYLEMSETDLVTGRHLLRIPRAAKLLVDSLKKKPSLLMICITCVDALLGTDMERVSRKAEELCGIPVRPCYMYALTREGRKPPMVNVRQSLYSLLAKRDRKSTTVNLLGYFAPLEEKCELRSQLRAIGVQKINEISTCKDMDEFLSMSEANFNIVLNPEARPAADDLAERLGIPYIELTRLYQIDQIERQYTAFGNALGYVIQSPVRKQQAESAVAALQSAAPGLVFSIGEAMNGNPFELALALLRYGFAVREIFGNPAPDYYVYMDQIAALSPDTRIYSNMDPSMLYYEPCEVDVTIGKDAAFYHPAARHVLWNSDVQPFGYEGVRHLFEQILSAVKGAQDVAGETAVQIVGTETAGASFADGMNTDRCDSHQAAGVVDANRLRPDTKAPGENADGNDGNLISLWDREEPKFGSPADAVLPNCHRCRERPDDPIHAKPPARISHAGAAKNAALGYKIKGFRRYLTPFAPDQSGAETVLYDCGGILTILDAGGCTGNVCGFDEPRWERTRSAVYSAGLRDMDAIMGRDELLVRKLSDIGEKVDGSFAAIIGTPVPSVIGTDYHALRRMAARKMDIPVLTVDTNGMELYDRGEEKAYLALFQNLTEEAVDRKVEAEEPVIGVIGMTPLDIASPSEPDRVRAALETQYPGRRIVIYGQGALLDDIRAAGRNEKNIVTSPSGIKAAEYLKRQFGTPFEITYPAVDTVLERCLHSTELTGNATHGMGESEAAHVTATMQIGTPEPLQTACHQLQFGKKILIVHQQVLANSLRRTITEMTDASAEITVASWFMMKEDLAEPQDVSLKEETDFVTLLRDGGYDCVIADTCLQRLVRGYPGTWIALPHFAVSGHYADSEC